MTPDFVIREKRYHNECFDGNLGEGVIVRVSRVFIIEAILSGVFWPGNPPPLRGKFAQSRWGADAQYIMPHSACFAFVLCVFAEISIRVGVLPVRGPFFRSV